MALVVIPQLLMAQSQLAFDRFSPEVRQIIAEEAHRMEMEAQRQTSVSQRFVVVTKAEEEFDAKVFGFTEQQVLDMTGDPHGAACSRKHLDGDMANRWCHAQVVKVADSFLREKGVSKNLSALMAASIFVVKEYGIDQHPSKSDLVVSEYEVFNNMRPQQGGVRVTATAFGDNALFFTIKRAY